MIGLLSCLGDVLSHDLIGTTRYYEVDCVQHQVAASCRAGLQLTCVVGEGGFQEDGCRLVAAVPSGCEKHKDSCEFSALFNFALGDQSREIRVCASKILEWLWKMEMVTFGKMDSR